MALSRVRDYIVDNHSFPSFAACSTKKSHIESPKMVHKEILERPMSTTGIIRDWKSGDQIAWIEDDCDVYSAATKHKFAMVRSFCVYSLSGEFLGINLQGADPMEIGIPSETVLRLKRLADESARSPRLSR